MFSLDEEHLPKVHDTKQTATEMAVMNVQWP